MKLKTHWQPALRQSQIAPWGRALLVSVLLAGTWGGSGPVRADTLADRREHLEPELMIETGARRGTCDVLTFTADGKWLLAAGDDKVVRVWRHDARGLSAQPVQTLRWSIWREGRGPIYALACTPDGEQVAVGGLGVRNGSVVVLRRATGDVLHAIANDTRNEEANRHVTMSLAFSPSGKRLAIGKQDGSVWLWDLTNGRIRRLGWHRDPDRLGPNQNWVRLVVFQDENRLLSAARDGTVVRWNVGESAPGAEEVLRFSIPRLYRVALSPDGRWLVAGGEKEGIEMRALDDQRTRTFSLPEGHYPHSLAFDPTGTQLAVGIRIVDPHGGFYKEVDHRIALYDLRQEDPGPASGPKVTGLPDALAFSPQGNRLAVAGGQNHEVTLWDLRDFAKGPLSVLAGPGRIIWDVGVSEDGRYLGYRAERVSNPSHPNERGAGAWHVFSLMDRQWSGKPGFRPIPRLDSAAGWSVQPDPRDAHIWRVVGPNGNLYPLPLNPAFDERPTCYTFLPAREGQPARLAVGHYWGFSVFALDPSGPRRIHLFRGHQGAVTAIALGASPDVILTASKDETIAAWSLTEGASRSPLGMRWATRLGRLFVDEVDPGGPAWEAGVTAGDEIVNLRFDTKDVPGGAAAWQKRLAEPQPNLEHAFTVRRTTGESAILATRVRERPLWHFFPTQNGEWVLWRHFDFFYDASPNGDRLIGWQISHDVDQKPDFYPARQFSDRFYNPEKVAEALHDTRFVPRRVSFLDLVPPQVALQADPETVAEQEVAVTVSAWPQGRQAIHRPERLVLWINDYRYRDWPLQPEQLDDKGTFHDSLRIPPALLRSGDNRLVLQCSSSHGALRSSEQLVVHKTGAVPAPRLFVVQVGVKDYRRAEFPIPGRSWENLGSVEQDFDLLRDAWKAQEGKAFARVEVDEPLLDDQVSAAALTRKLQTVAAKARPDDLLVLFLNGHGYTEERGDGKGDKEGTFIFVGSRFSLQRPTATGITADEIYRGLTKVPCRKLVLLSACHAGDATKRTLREPLRALTPDGVGPVILSAAQLHENAWAPELGESLFARAIAEAIHDRFRDAAHGRDQLDTVDFVSYVMARVPVLLEEMKSDNPKLANQTQRPVCFPELRTMDRFPLARQPAGETKP
jgi:WD40 repeat protein